VITSLSIFNKDPELERSCHSVRTLTQLPSARLAGGWLVPCKKHYVIFISRFVERSITSWHPKGPLCTQKFHFLSV